MLKAQLRSKISQLGSGWRDVEDILTGDFFGTLDYLPRYPFLRSFVEWVARLNPTVTSPCIDDVEWDDVRLLFWPMTHAEDDSAEPDVVMISNRWVIVIEVKLESGLGATQPWREYVVGTEIGREHSIAPDSVYYLVVARRRLDVESTVPEAEPDHRQTLRNVTFHLLWSHAASLIDHWLRRGSDHQVLAPHVRRLLSDLLDAMRRRRALVFSGFSFAHQNNVSIMPSGVFSPPRFHGFLGELNAQAQSAANNVFFSRFAGFGPWQPCHADCGQASCKFTRFVGFLRSTCSVDRPVESLLWLTPFCGFLGSAPRCFGHPTFQIPD